MNELAADMGGYGRAGPISSNIRGEFVHVDKLAADMGWYGREGLNRAGAGAGAVGWASCTSNM